MPAGRAFTLASAALLLPLAAPVLAHGHEDMKMDTTMGADIPPPPRGTADPMTYTFTGVNGQPTPLSYFAYPEHAGVMYAHIALMVVGWSVLLPVACAFSIARSRLTLPTQLLFLIFNALGVLTAVIYKSQTPDLYENNSHHKAGWAITWIASAWVTIGLVNLYSGKSQTAEYVALPGQPVSAEAMDQHHRIHGYQAQHEYSWSRDSGHGTERNSTSLFGANSLSPTCEPDRPRFPDRQSSFTLSEVEDGDVDEKRGFLPNSAVDKFLSRNVPRIAVGRTLTVVRFLYAVLDRMLLLLGFLAISTGAAVYGGVFRGSNVFSGLAHFIKGAIFFWYGLLTLGRWMGCFADFGWAWNIRPTKDIVGRRKAALPTAEFTESFVIFLYGASNVFLEHLAAWGGEWTAQDLEHISITILFFGGGLLGMLVESRKIRSLLNTSIIMARDHVSESPVDPWQTPRTYNFPFNPMPALVILLLGLMMGSHHQASMTAAVIHKQWGSLFVGFALARAATYIILYISPPTSYLPSRPPSELISAFCLMSGGLIFMESSKDTVAALENNGLDAMFGFTVLMGLTALIMAWSVIVIAIRGWAVRRENASFFSKQAAGVLA